MVAFSAGGDGGTKPGWGRMANAKSIGWAIYAAGFVIWLSGYLSAGHASIFHWDVFTPWWISSFAPNLEAELGLAHVREHDPDLLARRTEATVMRGTLQGRPDWLAYSPSRPF